MLWSDVCAPDQDMEVPSVTVDGYQLSNIDDSFLCSETSDGKVKDDVKFSEGDVGKAIRDYEKARKKISVRKPHVSPAKPFLTVLRLAPSLRL
jgi:hypothetical protein